MIGRPHTDREYEAQLLRLMDLFLLMGARVEEMISQGVRSLVERDSRLAKTIIDGDIRVDRLEIEIDELCMAILALRQPVASDLRFITTILKMDREIERIGDLAVNICERVIELNEEPPLKPYVDIPRMSDEARGMVRDALDALVHNDAVLAQEVITRDSKLDAYFAQIVRELLTYMMEDPRNIYRATRVQSIAKHIERIGDHATNLAEMVIFNVKGKDVRHSRNRPAPDTKCQ
jgi:phosphate transport system protein